MNARELIQDIKSHIEVKRDIEEAEIQVDIIGNSQEAKAQVSYWVEGKRKLIELKATVIE